MQRRERSPRRALLAVPVEPADLRRGIAEREAGKGLGGAAQRVERLLVASGRGPVGPDGGRGGRGGGALRGGEDDEGEVRVEASERGRDGRGARDAGHCG